MLYSAAFLLSILAAASGKELPIETDSLTFKQQPQALAGGIDSFVSSVVETAKASKHAKKSLRDDTQPNKPLKLSGYMERVPQLDPAETYLKKETFVGNQKCHIEYNKYSKPTMYMSHVLGMDSCYLSTFTTSLEDPSTYTYVKSSYEKVDDSEAGPSFQIETTLYKDSACTEEAKEVTYSRFTDILPQTCTKKADGVSTVSELNTEPPPRNTKLNKGASVR
jgi:hypothetical protein